MINKRTARLFQEVYPNREKRRTATIEDAFCQGYVAAFIEMGRSRKKLMEAELRRAKKSAPPVSEKAQ